MSKEYDFGEKIEEYSSKQRKKIPVWISPKYTQSREKAIEIIEKYTDITAGDFWILMNETKTGKMAYTGLIISHNACLKINDAMDEKMRFKPSCMILDTNGYKDSLVYTYVNDEQGIYEVGEVSAANCKNAYPYAMALKRCFDRVVLKICKLAYNGVYSDSEADEFRENRKEPEPEKDKLDEELATNTQKKVLLGLCEEQGLDVNEMLKKVGVKSKMTKAQYGTALNIIKDMKDGKKKK